MKRIANPLRKELIEAAQLKRPLDLLLRGGRLINVFTAEIYPADVGIYGGFIAFVRRTDSKEPAPQAKEIIDIGGSYLSAGLIDAHVHIESSMLTPYAFSDASLVHGTTTVITDPHEMANVLGIDGVAYMAKMGEAAVQRQFIVVPSCVPAAQGVETAGAAFSAEDIAPLLDWENVLGLGELMDYADLLAGGPRMMSITQLAFDKGVFAQGHAPSLSGGRLAAYIAAGVQSDHETRTGAEALEKIRSGLYVDARYSSISKDTAAIWEGIKDLADFRRLTLCTDDREPDDILHEGHMNAVVRSIVRAGMDPIRALQSATLNVAEEAGLRNIGAIAAGFTADLVVFDDLKDFKARMVFVAGRKVAEDGRLTEEGKSIPPLDEPLRALESVNTLHLKAAQPSDFHLEIPTDHIGRDQQGREFIRVSVMAYRSHVSALTRWGDPTVLYLDHRRQPILPPERDLRFIGIFYRYEGRPHHHISLVENFGLRQGAVGATVSHDSHNLTIVYDTPQNALCVYDALRQSRGGFAAADRGELRGLLALPLGGLLSLLSAEELSPQIEALKKVLQDLGLVQMPNPLLRIVTAALAVIPEVKITDLGVVDVNTQRLRSVFLDPSADSFKRPLTSDRPRAVQRP